MYSLVCICLRYLRLLVCAGILSHCSQACRTPLCLERACTHFHCLQTALITYIYLAPTCFTKIWLLGFFSRDLNSHKDCIEICYFLYNNARHCKFLRWIFYLVCTFAWNSLLLCSCTYDKHARHHAGRAVLMATPIPCLQTTLITYIWI